MKDRLVVLMADDDSEDRMLVEEAWKECRLANPLLFVHDGEELMDYLLHRGKYEDVSLAPRPGLILLDLNMPRKSGREALAEIKQNPELRIIPVVILTTSRAEEDILRTYDLGANSFVAKPVRFDGLVAAVRAIGTYWFELVELPCDETGGRR